MSYNLYNHNGVSLTLIKKREGLYLEGIRQDTLDVFGLTVRLSEIRCRASITLASLTDIIQDALDERNTEVLTFRVRTLPTTISLTFKVNQPYNKYSFSIRLPYLPQAEGHTIIREREMIHLERVNMHLKICEMNADIVQLTNLAMYHSYHKIFRIADVTPPISILSNTLDDLHAVTHYSYPTTNSISPPHHIFCEIELDLFLEMPNIRVLEIHAHPTTPQSYIKSLDFLKNCRKLERLSLHHTALIDITALENISTLESVQLDDNPDLVDISVLKKCLNLKSISACRTKVIEDATKGIRPPLQIIL